MYTSRPRNTAVSRTVIIFLGILLNFVLFFISARWKLPFWMDSTGTAYVALLLGPLPALIVGLIHTLILIFFFYGSSAIWFYSVSILIALVVGIGAEERVLKGFSSVCGVTFILYVLTTLLSSLLVLVFCGGQVKNIYAAMFLKALLSGGISPGFSTLIALGAVALPDVIVTAVLVAILYFCTPSSCKKY